MSNQSAEKRKPLSKKVGNSVVILPPEDLPEDTLQEETKEELSEEAYLEICQNGDSLTMKVKEDPIFDEKTLSKLASLARKENKERAEKENVSPEAKQSHSAIVLDGVEVVVLPEDLISDEFASTSETSSKGKSK